MFLSDKVGKCLGPLHSQELRGEFINICSPGSNYSNIVHKANSIELNELSSLVILCGNSLSLGKRELLLNVQTLLSMQNKSKCSITLCAFPYCQNLNTEQNIKIQELNILMYNLTCRHSDALLFFDTNKFISNFTLTPDTMYLSRKFKKQIACLLAYNINNRNKTSKPIPVRISNCTNNFYNDLTSSLN